MMKMMINRHCKYPIILGLLVFIGSASTGFANVDELANSRSGSVLSESAGSSEWLLVPGLLGIDQGIWLILVSLGFSITGAGLAILVWYRLPALLSRIKRDLSRDITDRLSRQFVDAEKAHETISRLSKEARDGSAKLIQLQAAYQRLEDKHSRILSEIDSLRVQKRDETLSSNFQLPSSTPTSGVVAQPCELSPAQKQAELTAAVNRGDRQVLENESRVQLNITHASENAISTGRLSETQLEEVPAGGSYWAASFADQIWLYPTEQTLKGYSHSQRPTGIFNYSRQSISTAQVIFPARLVLKGNLWQVIEMGSIAVPG